MPGPDSSPAPHDTFSQAASALAAGDADAALAALAVAGATSPEALPLRFLTAMVAWYLGDAAQALGLMQRCFDEQPMNGTIAEVLASLYAQAGNLVESLYYGKLATALGPEPGLHALLPPVFPSFGRAFLQIQEKPLLAQARIQLAGGNLALALDRAHQHVAVAPGDAEGRIFYAETLLRAGLAGRAVEALRPAMSGAVPAVTASLMARSLAAVGEVAEARSWHAQACALAPDEPAIGAAKLADAPWLGEDEHAVAAEAAQWAQRFLKPKRARRWRPLRDRLVIGYLVSRFTDRRDAAAVAAVARAHTRPDTQVIAYGFGAQSWMENATLAAAFDQWRDIGSLDPATLARMIAVDGVDVAIDAGGFAAPVQLQALARIATAIRVAWLTPPTGLEDIVYDVAIQPPSRCATATEGIDFWQPTCGVYPLPEAAVRRVRPSVAPATRFGSDALLAEITGETVALWRGLLAAAPSATLLLHAHDMARGPNINRLVERFGADLAARIDVIEAASAADFYAEIEVAVAPAAGLSPFMTAGALSSGVPVVALRGSAAADFLADRGLLDAIAPDAASYIGLARRLAAAPPQTGAPAAPRHAQGTAREIAAAIETSARAALAKAAA